MKIVNIKKITRHSIRYDLEVSKNKNFYANKILVHNCSMTAFLDFDGEFHVCSRNLSLKPDENNAFWSVALRHDIEAKMREHQLFGYALQGELIGGNIQGNPYKMTKIEVYIFDVYSVEKGEYLLPAARYDIVEKLGLEHVPVMSTAALLQGGVDGLLKAADGTSVMGVIGTPREGLVYKSVTGGFSFKAISNKWAMGAGE